MIITKRSRGYSSQRKYIYGKGFVDSLRSIGSYITQNKDLLAKPMLGAVGNLGAFGLTEGGKALITHLINKKRDNKVSVNNSDLPQLSSKGKEILESIINSQSSNNPVTNIIGSGLKKF
jgi:hypothetical protein